MKHCIKGKGRGKLFLKKITKLKVNDQRHSPSFLVGGGPAALPGPPQGPAHLWLWSDQRPLGLYTLTPPFPVCAFQSEENVCKSDGCFANEPVKRCRAWSPGARLCVPPGTSPTTRAGRRHSRARPDGESYKTDCLASSGPEPVRAADRQSAHIGRARPPGSKQHPRVMTQRLHTPLVAANKLHVNVPRASALCSNSQKSNPRRRASLY